MGFIALGRMAGEVILIILGIATAASVSIGRNQLPDNFKCPLYAGGAVRSDGCGGSVACCVTFTEGACNGCCDYVIVAGVATILCAAMMGAMNLKGIMQKDTTPKGFAYAEAAIPLVNLILSFVAGLIVANGLSKTCSAMSSACQIEIKCSEMRDTNDNNYYDKFHAAQVCCFIAMGLWLMLFIVGLIRVHKYRNANKNAALASQGPAPTAPPPAK